MNEVELFGDDYDLCDNCGSDEDVATCGMCNVKLCGRCWGDLSLDCVCPDCQEEIESNPYNFA
jgi:hypothetical protein